MPLETIRTQLHSNPHQQMVNPQVLQAYQLSQQSQQSLTYKTEKIQILTDDLSASSNVASTRVGGSGKTQKTSGLEVICEPNPCIPITSLCETDDSSKGYRCNEVRPSQEFVDQPNISTSTSTTRDVATTLVSSTANSSRASGTVATAVDVCMAVTCSFDTDLCKYKSSSWTWTNSRRLLNKLTGVRGDHSGTGSPWKNSASA